MRTEIPKMTYEERQARAQAKKDTILGFLASGEVYTSVVVAAQVMAASPSAAERTLTGLVRDGALKCESHMVGSRKIHLYGIPQNGAGSHRWCFWIFVRFWRSVVPTDRVQTSVVDWVAE